MNLLNEITRKISATLTGFILYYFFPRKTSVFIVSSMRSGSTLLKALLAEAPDVSHLSERLFDAKKQWGKNKYAQYCRVYFASKKKIIIFKHPRPLMLEKKYDWNCYDPSKVIVLVRNPFGFIKSALAVSTPIFKTKSVEEFIDYWCTTYEDILHDMKTSKQAIVIIKYEDLVKNPEKTTERLFAFIGSSQKKGVSTYKQPSQNIWDWGKDDGGELIKTLKVSANPIKFDDDKYRVDMIKSSERVEALRTKLGYDEDWK